MNRFHPVEDPARRWRRFCRTGRRMAWMFAALWFGSLALLFRVASAPSPGPWDVPTEVSWWPGPEGGGAEESVARDVRALWTPSAFALSSPAGFSHALRRERAASAPPVQVARPGAAFSGDPRPGAGRELPGPEIIRSAVPPAPAGFPAAESVFPPRTLGEEAPRLAFPEGWESRLFSGIDLDFGAWTNAAWSARVEMRFDAKGIPASTMLTQSSGNPEVDRRLARSTRGWRLLEPSAPRAGVVAWSSPSPAARPPTGSAEKGEP